LAITPQQIAIAAEALNRLPDLSAIARRVALELLNFTDRKSGIAWPSEAHMAAALGISDRSVRRAKAELRALGLLTWRRRGTSWRGRTPVYMLALDKLLSIAKTIKNKVKAAAQAARRRLVAPSSPPVSKPVDNGPRPIVDRTSSVHLHSPTSFSFRNGDRGKTTYAKPQGQVLTDAQIVAKASTRIHSALLQLGHAAYTQFLDRPDAHQLEAAALDAERWKPNKGYTGAAVIAARLGATA
jgi:DNA-binding transcriptional MocR family regulator